MQQKGLLVLIILSCATGTIPDRLNFARENQWTAADSSCGV